LPGSLAQQPCPAALPGSLARQPCPAALPGSLAQQPCPAAFPGSLARQPFRNITSLKCRIAHFVNWQTMAFYKYYKFNVHNCTFCELADHALLKMVRYVLLRILMPELYVIQK
jgi:hypothetical protein